jgi:hypothetical protein
VDPNRPTTTEAIDGLPLHLCVLYKQPYLIDELIRLGADVNLIEPHSGNTALMMAVILQEEYSARKLLEKGADPTLRSSQGRAPLYVAAERGNCNLLTLLIKGFRVNPNLSTTTERHGGGALHIAAMFNKPNAVHHLLQLGADPMQRDRNGRTPLDVAKLSAATLAIEVINSHFEFSNT